MDLQTASAWGQRVAAAAAAVWRRRRPLILTIVGRERGLGLACCEQLAAASRHPRVVTAEIPVLYAAGAYGSPRNWSALPDLPLSLIARRLHTLKDFLSFRGVCTSWRSVGIAVAEDVMASHPPLFFGTVFVNGGESKRRFYHPGENRFYKGDKPIGRTTAMIAGVSHGYFILGCSGRPTVFNPLTGEEKNCFPPSRRFIRTLGGVLLSSPPTSPGCVIVEWDRWNIQYCRPGDKEWCLVGHRRRPSKRPDGPRVLSVAVVGGKGYALIRDVGLASFDLTAGRSTVRLTVLQDNLPDMTWYTSCFLAEHNGELFALPILTRSSDQVADNVFRFDPTSSKWVVLDDLGGRSVLVVSF